MGNETRKTRFLRLGRQKEQKSLAIISRTNEQQNTKELIEIMKKLAKANHDFGPIQKRYEQKMKAKVDYRNERILFTQYLKEQESNLLQKFGRLEEMNQKVNQFEEHYNTKLIEFTNIEKEVREINQHTQHYWEYQKILLNHSLIPYREYLFYRDEVTKRIYVIETKLAQQAKQHKDELCNYDIQKVIEMDSIKKEMVKSVNDFVSMYIRSTQILIIKDSAFALRENVALNLELDRLLMIITYLSKNIGNLRKSLKHMNSRVHIYKSEKNQLYSRLIKHKVMRKGLELEEIQTMGLYSKCIEHNVRRRALANEILNLNNKMAFHNHKIHKTTEKLNELSELLGPIEKFKCKVTKNNLHLDRFLNDLEIVMKLENDRHSRIACKEQRWYQKLKLIYLVSDALKQKYINKETYKCSVEHCSMSFDTSTCEWDDSTSSKSSVLFVTNYKDDDKCYMEDENPPGSFISFRDNSSYSSSLNDYCSKESVEVPTMIINSNSEIIKKDIPIKRTQKQQPDIIKDLFISLKKNLNDISEHCREIVYESSDECSSHPERDSISYESFV